VTSTKETPVFFWQVDEQVGECSGVGFIERTCGFVGEDEAGLR